MVGINDFQIYLLIFYLINKKMTIPYLWSMTEADIIQQCRLETGDYSKIQLMELIEGMTQADFNTFCKQVEYLRYLRTISYGAYATFDREIYDAHKDKMFPLIDSLDKEDFELPFDRAV